MAEGDGKEEEIENLSEGEHSDNDESLQPKNTFRQGLNGNLISKGGNHYSYESEKGTMLSFTLPTHKKSSTEIFVPTGMFPVGKQLVVHSTNNQDDTGGDGEIGIVDFDASGNGTYKALYYHAKLRYSQKHMIGNEGYCLAENDSFHRNYYSDDFNQPRCVNVANPIFTTYFASGSLVNGDTYMVITDTFGYVTYNGVDYGPLQAAGNIFTANATAVFTPHDNPHVIKLLNPLVFDYTPQKMIDTIRFKSYALDGQLNAGVKMYAYQLYTDEGYFSSWTFTTNPVSVSASIPGTDKVDAFQGSGYASTVNTGKSITMTVDNIPIDIFDNIRVAVIEINQAYEVATDIEVFWDSSISGATMDVTHFGQEDLETLLLDDLVLKNAVIITCKSMATTKQRQTQHNITTQQQVEADLTAATVSPFTYTFPADKANYPNAFESIKEVLSNPSGGVPSGNIAPDGMYVVRGTGSVTYNAIVYTVGQTFTGVFVAGSAVITYAVTSGAPIVKACIRIQKYLKFAGSVPVYDIIELNDEFWGYTSMAYTEYLKGYWREEKYRFGYLFFDKFGNPMLVQWLADVTVPSQSASQPYNLLKYYGSDGTVVNDWTSTQIVGMQADNLILTPEVAAKIGGVAMVRVKRDKQIFGQGIIQQMTNFGAPLVPVVDVRPSDDANVVGGLGHTTPFYWGMLSPELDFGLPNSDPLPLLSGDSLKGVADLEAVQAPVAAHAAQPYDIFTAGDDSEIYSKYYKHNNFQADPAIVNGLMKIEVVKEVDTGASALVGGIPFMNDKLDTTSTHAPAPNSTSAAALHSRVARGGQRTVIKTSNRDIVNNLTGVGTGVEVIDIGTERKVLVNYVRPKNNLYGGDSDSAKAAARYFFCGHYIAITDALLADIFDGVNYVLNGMQFFGGDCFVNIYDRVNTLWDDGGGAPMSWGHLFPCESEINVALRQGVNMTHNGLSFQGGVEWDKTGAQHLEDFNYNKAYSSENELIKYDGIPVGFKSQSRFPYLNRYSEIKVLGELVDNMRVFLINNFKNVDALHGEVTKGIVINDLLYVLQERGVAYIPIDERELISAPIAGATQLGVGGVMERYDTKDYYYGCQHKHSVFLTENGIGWFDMIRKTILTMRTDSNVIDIAVLKGKEAFYQEEFDPNNNPNLSDLFLDEPLLGFGIIGYYDPKHKTAFLTFKYAELQDGEKVVVKKDFTQGISSTLDKFVGTGSYVPGIVVQHLNYLFAVNVATGRTIESIQYAVGNEVVQAGVTYVCYLAYLSTGTQPASDPAHWKRTSDGSQVHRFWEGNICKFFGIVYPYELTKVFGSSNYEEEKSFDNIEAYGNEVGFTDVYHNSSELSSQDTNISTVNKNFKYINNAWWFSVALTSVGRRVFDRWMKTKVVVKNYDTDPTVSNNKVKRIVYMRLVSRFKK